MKHPTLKLTLLAVAAAWSMSAAADSYVKRDTLVTGDSIIIIETACAPICSSRARVYVYNNKEWKEAGILRPPFEHAVFPEAYIEDNKIRWRDNTPAEKLQ